MIVNIFSKSIVILILLLSSAWAADVNSSDLAPDPKYSPSDVVSMQMEALGKNNTPHQDAGIETSFRFASPENKKSTGPLERFKLLFKNSDYAPSKEGKKILYIFRLDKQTKAPYENCWMTSGVIRIPTDSLEDIEDKPV